MKQTIKLMTLMAVALAATAATTKIYASGFAAPVQIANTDSSPVPVRDVTNVTRKPFQISLYARSTATAYQVPSKKRMVIEQISGNAYVSNAVPEREFVEVDTQLSAADSVDGQIAYGNHIFALNKPNGRVYVLSNQLVKLYASADTRILILFPTSEQEIDTGNAVFVTLTGYIEDVN